MHHPLPSQPSLTHSLTHSLTAVGIRGISRWISIVLLASSGLVSAEEKAPFTVELLTTREKGRGTVLQHGSGFEVRLRNRSGKAVAVWDRECEPGHSMLSFTVKGPEGDRPVIQVSKAIKVDWSKYPLKKIAIPAGKSRTVKVNFLSSFYGREWENVPEPNTGERVEMKVVLEIPQTAAAQEQGVWTGRIESTPVKLQLVNADMETPQQYLWDDCPGMALKLMKQNPALINKKDPEDSCTPLHHAARYAHREVVVWLLANGADVNAECYNRFTPLHFATSKEIAELLLKAGAKADHVDAWGKTAIQDAAAQGHQGLVDAILEAGGKVDLVTVLVLKKRDLAIRMLMEDAEVIVGGGGGADLRWNTTPLGLAAGQGDLELVKLLLEAGAPLDDPTHVVPAGGTATPLCNAVWAKQTEMVEFLLKRGASTEVVGGKFYSSITDYAKKHSDKRIVELLEGNQNNNGQPSWLNPPVVRNKLPGRIAAGDFKVPEGLKVR
jgi:ankyrin repeat protein